MSRSSRASIPSYYLPLIVASALCMLSCDDASSGAIASGPAEVVAQPIDRSITLRLNEVWRVGDASDQHGVEFFRVAAAALSENGSAYILDSGNNRVVVLNTQGQVTHQFGGEGEGPGEFTGALGLVVRGDTVMVQDRGNRLHFFSSDGSVVATRLLQFPDAEVNSLGLIAATHTEWVAASVGYFSESSPGTPPVYRVYFFRTGPSGEVKPLGLRWSRESPGRYEGIFWLQPILQHRSSIAMDGLGRLLVADTLTYRIDFLSLEGKHLLRVENEVALQRIDGSLIDQWRDSRDCPSGQEEALECSKKRDRIILGMERAEHRPVVARIRAHPSGHFSVLRADLDPNPFDGTVPSEYDHFRPDGSFLGTTSGLIPLWLNETTLIALSRDDVGVESIALYEVLSEQRRTR